MKTELEWRGTPAGLQLASHRHYSLGVWRTLGRNGKAIWQWDVVNSASAEFIGMGYEDTERAAKDAATTRARNKDHGQ